MKPSTRTRSDNGNLDGLSQMQTDGLDFRALADTIEILCWIANPDGFIVWYNRRWYEYTGTNPAEMEGWGWQSVHDPAELPRVLSAWRDSIASGRPFEMVFPLRGADGKFRPFLTRGSPTLDANGEVTAWYGVNTDISEQTFAEMELRERREAEQKLIAANAAAEEARQQAEHASVAKTEFLASMSHEIRTPLNAIIGYSDILLEENPNVPGLSRKLQLIQDSSAALLVVVNDILDFSKIEAGQIEIEPATFSPVTLVDNVVSMLGAFAEKKGVKLTRAIDERVPPFLVGDDARLRQIVLNLVNNAIKFTPQGGGVSVAVQVESLGGSDAWLRFAITDSGIGIGPEQQKTLFQRFSQVDGSISRKYGGTGLGLAICKQLVELMGGSIGVGSRLGEGSIFWFLLRLPIAVPQAPAVTTAVTQTDEVSGVSILLVEDVEVNQDLAKAVLERWGHQVAIASDGAEAIEEVKRTRYDLVLMDVQMPGMDGVTATRLIRGSGHPHASVPIVAMTANVLPQQIAALRDAGMDDHIGEPFKAANLQAVIGRWTGRPTAVG